jgi:hypothetical protein
MRSQRIIKAAKVSEWSHGFLATAGALWILGVVTGFLILAQEEFTPVKASPQVALFPRSSALKLVSDKPTLVLFAHPHCPCTRASLHELDGLLAQAQNRVSAIVVFTIPDGVPAGWEKGDLWNEAATIPGLRVIRDLWVGKRTNLTSRVRDMSYCLLLPGSCFSAAGSPGPVDTKATT